MRLFLDTNIFLRFFTADEDEMFTITKSLFQQVETSKIHVATSTVVLTEVMYTLRTFYKQDRESIVRHITSILAIKNLVLIDKTDFKTAFKLYIHKGQKISDYLIVTQIPKNYHLCSFDKRLEKLIGKDRFVFPGSVV